MELYRTNIISYSSHHFNHSFLTPHKNQFINGRIQNFVAIRMGQNCNKTSNKLHLANVSGGDNTYDTSLQQSLLPCFIIHEPTKKFLTNKDGNEAGPYTLSDYKDLFPKQDSAFCKILRTQRFDDSFFFFSFLLIHQVCAISKENASFSGRHSGNEEISIACHVFLTNLWRGCKHTNLQIEPKKEEEKKHCKKWHRKAFIDPAVTGNTIKISNTWQ